MNPGADAVLHILRVGMQDDFTRALEQVQGGNHRLQFHAVIGGFQFAATKFFFLRAVAQQSTPAAGAGIALAGAIGINLNDQFKSFIQKDASRPPPPGCARSRKHVAIAAQSLASL